MVQIEQFCTEIATKRPYFIETSTGSRESSPTKVHNATNTPTDQNGKYLAKRSVRVLWTWFQERGGGPSVGHRGSVRCYPL